MAFLDAFNKWYNKLVPEVGTEAIIQWVEPVAGARRRWKQGWKIRLTWLMIIFLLGLVIPSRRMESATFERRLLVSSVATGFFALVGWLSRDVRQKITLRSDRVYIGTGRSTRRLSFDQMRAISLRPLQGHTVLVLAVPDDEEEFVFLDAAVAGEVSSLLEKAGRLKPSPNPIGSDQSIAF